MRKGILAALAGISLLLVGGLLLVQAVERPPAGSAPAPAPAAVAAPVPAPITLPPPQPPAASPAPAAATPQAAPAAPPQPFDAAALQRSLEPMRREVLAGLAGLAGRVHACKLHRNEFQVSLESFEGRVRIVEAIFPEPDPALYPEGVAPPPPEDPRAIACVKGAMQGVVISSPNAKPGRSWQQAWTDRGE